MQPGASFLFCPLAPGTQWALHARSLNEWHGESRTCVRCKDSCGESGSQRLHQPRSVAPAVSNPPPLDHPRPKCAKSHGLCRDALLGRGGPCLRGEPQCPGYGAGTHCNSGRGLGKADRASRWQSAWRVGTTVHARPAGRDWGTEV